MNILIADDEKLALQMLHETVQEVLPEADIFPFQFGGEAIEAAKTTPMDIAFLDISMRDMSGLEVAKALKEIRGETNIVFVTAYSEYALDAIHLAASDYLMKPVTAEAIEQAMTHLRNPVKQEEKEKLVVRCFGDFSVFYQGTSVHFKRQRAQELFACLIDRQGGPMTFSEVANLLWEDGIYNISRNKQIHTMIASLVSTFDELGLKDMIIRRWNSLELDTTRIACDYFAFLRGDPDAVNGYLGEYMAQYSWAEFTNAALSDRAEKR